ncbi:MAG: hypothetical protein M3380_00410, partial [Chloroflexota bacterium]|nr:hypothetical protein [Chloroflexota bacterium]
MQTVGLVLRTLLGVPLFFYMPGYILQRAFAADRQRLWDIECHASRIVASMLIAGWVALLLAEIGWFSYWLLAGSVLVLCPLLAFVLRRQLMAPGGGHRPPAPPLGIVAKRHPAPTSINGIGATIAAVRFDHLMVAIAALFGLLVARPFEVVRGGLDAGVYANTGISIARTGGIVLHDRIVAGIGRRVAEGDDQAQQVASNIFGVQDKDRHLATRLRAAGFFMTPDDLTRGRVVPQFFHLWPAWIAVFAVMLGVPTGLIATGAAGMLGVVLLGLIGRRVGGPLVGVLAATFLALMTPQVWFSRMPTSEALTQALLLAGLWAFIHFADARERRERIWWGALAGGAFGELALARIDFPLALAPLLLLLLYAALTRRWHAGYSAMALVAGVLLLHATLHILLIARAYFIGTTLPSLQKHAVTTYLIWPLLSPELRAYTRVRPGSKVGDWVRLVGELALLGMFVLGVLALWRRPRPLLLAESWVRRWRRPLLNACVLGLGLLACYAYVIRPGILNGDVLRLPLRPDNWLRLQGYVGAPIEAPFHRYPHKPTLALALANMVRLGWYLSPLGVALGVTGGLGLWRRLDRRTWLLVVVATAYACFYIQSLQGTTEQTNIYILRRFVPMVYPAFALGMAYALVALVKGRGHDNVSTLPATLVRHGVGRTARAGLFLVFTASLLLFFVVTGRPVYAHVEYAGTLAQIATLSDRVRAEDVVLVRGGGATDVAVRDTSELVAPPLTYVYGRNALPVKGRWPGKYAAAFADQVTLWRDEGRRVYLLLAASGGDMLFPGYALRSVDTWTLRLREFQQLKDQKPKQSYLNEVPFHLYELVPASGAARSSAIGYNDTAAQVTG